MLRGFWTWINGRWPVSPFVRALLVEDIPGGSSYFYSFGSSVLFVFILQAVTGIAQLFFYVPTVVHAYTSLSFLRTEVPFGWLIHNLHYWGATAMVVLVLLHVTRVFLWGAYKDPRQLTWLLGVFLFLLTLAMMFTGSPLPWDEKGYWATEVGTSIAGTVPLVGEFTKRLLRGGESMGQLTLSRFFSLHVALLAGLLGGFIILHLVSFRRAGSVGPWRESKRMRSGPFWPDQVQKDLVSACLVFVVLLALASFLPPAFTGPADPADAAFTPKPEWTFLSLYQALKLFPGPLEAAGTVGLPLALVLLLVGLPFIDRRAERNPVKRPLALAGYFAVLAAAVVLSIAGSVSSPGVGSSQATAAGSASQAAGGSTEKGAGLYQALGCPACHSINGTGGKVGPDLAAEKSRNRSAEWLEEQIGDPRSHNPRTGMPAFSRLTPGEVGALSRYLLSLAPKESGPAGASGTPSAEAASPEGQPAGGGQAESRNALAPRLIGNPGHGELLFAQYCGSCHGTQGKGGVPNPGSEDGTVPALSPIDRELYEPDPDRFVSKIDPFLQHGSVPPGSRPALKMPDFGDSRILTQQQIAHLEAYVLGLNGVERARIARPGLSPALFFVIVVAVFAASGLGLGAIWIRLRRRIKPGAPRGRIP
jgi:ubiquinol-cytochrome c reductase cytochrome b subunit